MPLTLRTLPLAKQALDLRYSIDRPVFSWCWEPGTGKSWLTLATLLHWHQTRGLNAALITAINGVHENWAGMIEDEHWPMAELPTAILTYRAGSAKFRRALEAVLPETRAPRFVFLLMNIEAFSSSSGVDTAARFLKTFQGSAAFVVDEFHKMRSPSALRTKALRKLAPLAPLRRMLSGTPHPKGYENLWAPYQWLDPSILETSTYSAFKAEFCVEQIFGQARNAFRKITGYRNTDRLLRLLAPHTSHVTLDECTDLPPVRGGLVQTEHGNKPIILSAPLGAEQKRLLDELRQYHFATLSTPEGVATLTAVNTGVAMMRAQQLSSGIVVTGEGATKTTHLVPSGKLRLAAELLADLGPGTKAIVWCRFRPEARELVRLLAEHGVAALGHEGGVPDDVRATMRDRWADDPSYPILVSTLATGNAGYTFNAAAVAVFVSNVFEWDTRFQAERRNRRIGQHKPTIIYDLVSDDVPADRYVLKVLAQRQNLGALWKTLTPDALAGVVRDVLGL